MTETQKIAALCKAWDDTIVKLQKNPNKKKQSVNHKRTTSSGVIYDYEYHKPTVSEDVAE